MYSHGENNWHRAPRAELGIGHYRYALVNIRVKSDSVMINRKIFATKISVSNIISNGYIEKLCLLRCGLEVSFYITKTRP